MSENSTIDYKNLFYFITINFNPEKKWTSNFQVLDTLRLVRYGSLGRQRFFLRPCTSQWKSQTTLSIDVSSLAFLRKCEFKMATENIEKKK